MLAFTDTQISLRERVGNAAPAVRQCQPVEAGGAKASQNFSVVQIRAFLVAAQTGSLSKAATQLGLSQPALSRRIKDLEAAIGRELFYRTQYGVELSTAGRALVPQAQRLHEAYESVQAFASGRRAGRRRLLRVAADASIAPVVLEALRGNLRRDGQDVELQLAAMGSAEAMEHVLDHRMDMALCGDMEGHPDLRYTPLLAAQLGLIIPPGCVLPETIRTLDDLAGVPLVRLAECTPVTRVLKRHGVWFPAYFGSPIVFSCLSAAFDSMREQKAAVVATGIGASLPQAQGMRFLALPCLLPSLNVHLVSARSIASDEHAEHMRDLLRQSVHQSPWHPSVQRLNRMHEWTGEDARTPSMSGDQASPAGEISSVAAQG